MSFNCLQYRSADIQVLIHHIYEYKKGVRSMVLHTMKSVGRECAENILKQKKINYVIQEVNKDKINIFFGNKDCVDIITSFNHKSLSDYTPEQDFILGIMLGYERNQQYKRYIKMQKKVTKQKLLSIA